MTGCVVLELRSLDSRLRGNDGARGRHGGLPPRDFALRAPPIGACRGAKPLAVARKSQVRNPKRVQGFVPAGVWGVPSSLYSPPRVGDTGG